jgi:60 kDa SS-A/Ro ribonucleoprotein
MNKSIFSTHKGKYVPPTDTVNAAGGNAYSFTPEHALVQYAVTGCFNNTFYSTGEAQLEKVLEIVQQCDPKFIGQVAIYARKRGFMKDMPAFLCAVLAKKDVQILKKVFPYVIDNGLMAKRFAHIIRTGVVGRKSFGTSVRGMLRKWVDSRSDDQLFRDSVGGDVSMRDLIKMIHPKPGTETRSALYAYLVDKEYAWEKLPPLVQQYESFKKKETKEVPDVPFQFLASLDIDEDVWREIARNAPWQMTRMNLNTFNRHHVFRDRAKDMGKLTKVWREITHKDPGQDFLIDKEMVKLVADRLRDREAIARSRVFPYQLMVAFAMTQDLPQEITDALQDAMEIAVENVPVIEGQAYVFPDASGSMNTSVTGYRPGSTSKMKCTHVAALVAAVFMRKNPKTRVIPFEEDVVRLSLNARDSIMTNSMRLASVGGGGTNCSAPMALLNREQAIGDLCIYVSDNESWVDSRGSGCGSACLQQWEIFRSRNPKAKLVCIDLVPNTYSNVPEGRDDILNIGGFSDVVFDVVNQFLHGELTADHMVGEVKKIDLDREKGAWKN